jgi:hypothetical protein
MVNRRFLVEPQILMRSPRLGVSVAEDVFEDVILGKHTMIGAKIVLVLGIVERCHLIIRYNSLGANWLSIKVISSKGKYGWKLCDLQLKPVTFECKVECGVKSSATPPSSGIKLSH